MKRFGFTLLLTFCVGAFLIAVSASPLSAGETWDNIKLKTANTKKVTQLKMMRSKYKDKIEDRYQELGGKVYENEELRTKVATDSACDSLINRITVYNKKLDKIDERIKEIEAGEDVSNEDIDAINEGIGLDTDESESVTEEKERVSDETESTDHDADDSDSRYSTRDEPTADTSETSSVPSRDGE